MRVRVTVPATSANLGPGFDCFGLALDLCNEVTVDTDAEPSVFWEGEGADELPTDGSDMVSRAVRHVAERRGDPLPSFALHGLGRIPLERGLGSSAAAAVAGAAVGIALLDHGADLDRRAVHEIAAGIEGHPDNAAAAAYGGLALVVDGVVHRLDPHPALQPVVLVPSARLRTDRARAALAAQVPRDDAVFNVGHASLALLALTRDPRLLPQALHDRLHEERRLSLVPGSRALVERLRDDGIATCLSGAGPSLLAFPPDGHPMPDPGAGWVALHPGVRGAGVEVLVET